MSEEINFIESYLDFFSGTEPPTIYNRWCAISGIATILGKQCWIQHGHSVIYPNQYIMLVGESGARKSTAIKKFLKPILVEAGFNFIAAQKTSKEKFLVDLAEGMDKINDPEEELNVNKPSGRFKQAANSTMRELFGIKNMSEVTECLIMADELNIFLGHGNIEFIELLGDLWDYEGLYPVRTKSGKSIIVPNPLINGLLGNTQQGISMAFPTETIGQGFFARLITVFSDPSGRKITFPPPPDLKVRKQLIETLMRIKGTFKGLIPVDPMAYIALDDIYQNWKDIDDVRFKTYSTRRLTHLLKLCLSCAAARERRSIDTRIVEYANSILHYTESFMPKALGEFGKARNSDVQAKIMELVEKSIDKGGLHPIEELWPQVSRDLDSTSELARVIESMKAAGKIQIAGSGKLLPNKKPVTFNHPHCKVGLLREYFEDKERTGMPI